VVETFEDRYVFMGEESRSGGMSVVRKAFDPVDGIEVAIKFVGAATDQLTRLIFERELVTLRTLSHQNIIRLRNAGIEKETGKFYLIFDWIDESFADVLARGVPYEWKELFSIIAEPLASALSHAHLKQVEHRDIKPPNVLITPQGRPLLADFGIAKMRTDLKSSDLTVAGFGSGIYTPPEMEAPPYVRDVYSMGVLLIQALHQDKIHEFHEIAPALDAIAVPPDLRKLLGKCVDPDPSMRPLNGTILHEELIRCSVDDRNRRAARRNIVVLRLTRAARRSLLPEQPEGQSSEAEAVVMADLGGEVFAEFRFDHDKKAIDRDTIFLIGNSWRFTLKPDDVQAGGFVIIGARQHEFEVLEAMRRRAMLIGKSVTWSWRPPGDIALAMSGLEMLQRSLEDFEDSKLVAREEARVRVDEDELFDAWLRLLQAREELARGERQPMRYRSRHVRRREADFTLYAPTDIDLVGTEVEVVVDETGRKIARGEVIAQYDDQITVRSHREFPALPDRGTLAPYLGPTNVALQRQTDAVSAIKSGSASKPDLREMVLDPSIVSAPVPVDVTVWNGDLDQSKRDAVSAALGASDFLLVQGPPGTGKTSFITETVAQVLRHKPDSRVLIVSQTHVAVDNSLERLDNSTFAV
jgi:Protein kinase domain/AAA domain